MKNNIKPLATTLSEVTTTIQYQDKVNFHKTVMMNLKEKTVFRYKNDIYDVPASDANHYPHSFWDIPRKLGSFYEQHELLAKFFDWFHFAKKIVPDIGFLYNKGEKTSYTFKVISLDAARTAFQIRHNTSLKDHHEAVRIKLLGPQQTPIKWLLIVGAVIICVIAIVVVLSLNGNHNQSIQTVQNVTSPITMPTSPFATPRIFGEP